MKILQKAKSAISNAPIQFSVGALMAIAPRVLQVLEGGPSASPAVVLFCCAALAGTAEVCLDLSLKQLPPSADKSGYYGSRNLVRGAFVGALLACLAQAAATKDLRDLLPAWSEFRNNKTELTSRSLVQRPLPDARVGNKRPFLKITT